MRLLTKGFDGKWYIYDDHNNEPSVLSRVSQRIQGILNKLDGEERDDRSTNNLSQCERQEVPDDDRHG